MNEVRLKFKTWFENYRFYEYLGRIEDALRGRASILYLRLPTSSRSSNEVSKREAVTLASMTFSPVRLRRCPLKLQRASMP